MNTKISIAATIAVFGLAATHAAAEGGEGNGDPFPFRAPASPVSVAYSPWAPDTGSSQYPAINPALSTPSLAQATLPQNGQNAAVETANSLPHDAMVGTPAYSQAQAADRWVKQAETRPLQPEPVMAQPVIAQAIPSDRPVVQARFEGYAPTPRVAVRVRMHKHHPRLVAHVAAPRHYASETPAHPRHHEELRRSSQVAYRFNRHPAALHSEMQDATRVASRQAVTPSNWWDAPAPSVWEQTGTVE